MKYEKVYFFLSYYCYGKTNIVNNTNNAVEKSDFVMLKEESIMYNSNQFADSVGHL